MHALYSDFLWRFLKTIMGFCLMTSLSQIEMTLHPHHLSFIGGIFFSFCFYQSGGYAVVANIPQIQWLKNKVSSYSWYMPAPGLQGSYSMSPCHVLTQGCRLKVTSKEEELCWSSW